MKKIYLEARGRFQSGTNGAQAAWEFGRACFDLADVATNNSQRAAIAGEGIAASRKSVALAPKSAPAHYYLGMNLAQLAQTKSLGALKIVSQMESEFSATLSLDEQFDFGGADRNLGLLYRDAPGWPISIGSRARARKHLQRAVELAPQYPENRLNLIEGLLKWSDHSIAGSELKLLESSLTEARAKFSGEVWAASWTDWGSRLKKVKAKIADKPVEAPKHP